MSCRNQQFSFKGKTTNKSYNTNQNYVRSIKGQQNEI